MIARFPTSQQRRAFIDSAGFLALVNPHDVHHHEARDIWARLSDEHWRTLTTKTTNFVVAETHLLFLVRLGLQHAAAFLQHLEGSSNAIVRVRAQDEDRAKQIIYRYTDKDFSLTDTTRFVVMERIGLTHVFTFDQHFSQYVFTTLAAQKAGKAT